MEQRDEACVIAEPTAIPGLRLLALIADQARLTLARTCMRSTMVRNHLRPYLSTCHLVGSPESLLARIACNHSMQRPAYAVCHAPELQLHRLTMLLAHWNVFERCTCKYHYHSQHVTWLTAALGILHTPLG